MTASNRRIVLGEIVGAHGIKGDVLVRSYTSEPADIAAYGPLEDATGRHKLTLTVRRSTSKGLVAHITGIDDRNAAEALKGTVLHLDRELLPDTGEEEFYHADLVGLVATDPQGRSLGTIVAVANYGAGDIIEVQPDDGGASALVPFTKAFVPVVDVAGGRVVVVMPSTPERHESVEDAPER